MLFSGPARIFPTAIVCLSILFGSSRITSGLAQGAPIVPTKACWTYKTEESVVSVDADLSKVYVAKDHARLEALSASGGERVWSTDLGGEVVSNLVAGNNQVFLVTQNDSGGRVVRSVSSATGITNWTSNLGGSGSLFLGIVGKLLIAASSDGKIAAFETADGMKRWLKDLGSRLSANPLYYSGDLLVGTIDKRIRIFSPADGNEKLNIPTSGEPTALSADGEDIYWGDARGNLFAYNIEAEDYRWQLKYGGRITGIVNAEDGLIFASADNFIYMVSDRYGNLRWKRRLNNRISELTMWTPDYLLVLDASGENVDVVDQKKGRLISQISPPSQQQFTLLPGASGDHAMLVTPVSISSYRAGGCTQN